jgi:hypothetical protein
MTRQYLHTQRINKLDPIVTYYRHIVVSAVIEKRSIDCNFQVMSTKRL